MKWFGDVVIRTLVLKIASSARTHLCLCMRLLSDPSDPVVSNILCMEEQVAIVVVFFSELN